MTKEEIVNDIYAAYGSDSGILFGIKEKSVVEAIVEFTLNRVEPDQEKDNLLKEYIEVCQEFVDRVECGEVRSKRTYAKFKQLLSKS